MMLFTRRSWNTRQRELHRKLYLEYRKDELLWYLDLFLSVNHPERAVKSFLNGFINNKLTVRQVFARALICGGDLSYSETIPYQDDMSRLLALCILDNIYISIKTCFTGIL